MRSMPEAGSDWFRPAMVWQVELRDGTRLSITADATFARGEDQIFEVALGDRPVVPFEIARVPRTAIASMLSEPTPAR